MGETTNNVVDFKNPVNQAKSMGVKELTDEGISFSTGSYDFFMPYTEIDKIEWDIIEGVFKIMVYTTTQTITDRAELIISVISIDSFIDGLLEIQQKLPKGMLIVSKEYKQEEKK